MPCTKDQQDKITPSLARALDEYQKIVSWELIKLAVNGFTKFSPIRFNRYNTFTMMRKHYDHIHSIFDGKKTMFL